MKKISLNIYFIVPLIFGLYSVFSFVVALQVIQSCILHQWSPEFPLAVSGGILFIISLIIGYAITRFVLKPAELFIRKIQSSPAVQSRAKEDPIPSPDRMEEFSRIFDQVAQALGDIDTEILFPGIVGKSRAMRQILSQIVKVAKSDATVLISGESGTGKELIAKGIVDHSPRKNKPLITLNCAAVSPQLIESELFGHERGAFTGAVARKRGCFEQADQGTLFLDEIGDMPLELQMKFLRVLQEQRFTRVGGETEIKVDVRIIAATHKDLQALIMEGKFRDDLYYRINVFPIFLPPLRERREDVEELALYFLKQAAPDKTLDPAALDLLKRHSWPGNVREMENMIQRAAVLADAGTIIEPRHLPDTLKTTREKIQALSGPAVEKISTTLDKSLAELEKAMICEALKETGGVQVRAAQILGIHQRSLWNRVKKYGIDVTAFKPETKT